MGPFEGNISKAAHYSYIPPRSLTVFLIRKFMTVASNLLALLVFWDKYFGIREKVGAVSGVIGNFMSGVYGKVSGDIEGEVETTVGGIKDGVEGLAKVAEAML